MKKNSVSIGPWSGLRFGAFVWLFGICTVQATAPTDDPATLDDRNWTSVGRTPEETHYSPLAHIHTGNVKALGLAWYLDLPGQRALEATPLAIDGVLYFSGTHGKTFAVDARTGQQLWQFDPQSGQHRPDIFQYSGSLGAHRGVAYWRAKIYVGSTAGELFALDAKTGKVIWRAQTFDSPEARNAISGAPRVFGGRVIIGNGAERGEARGYVTAFDAETGQLRWRFYTVPGDPKSGFENPALAAAAKTWRGPWWKKGGNGSVWNGITYDPDFDRVYIGTGSVGPAVFPIGRQEKDDHLFTSSIVALDAETGAYVWHYQETPGGVWDYDSTSPMVLSDLILEGKSRKVLMHAPKNGFFYVIDRATGKLLSAQKYAKATWAARIDVKSGRPVPPAEMREMWPSGIGAHSWQPMSFNPVTRLMYIPTVNLGHRIVSSRLDELLGLSGALLAWDPVTQTKRWEVGYDSLWNGGALSTQGNLVFQGTARGQVAAFHALTGTKLWSFDAGLGIVGAPISYQVDGTQYVSILVGYGGGGSTLGKLADYGWRFNEQPRRLLTFALGKQTHLPPGGPPRFKVKAVDDPALVIDAEQAAAGADVYHAAFRCALCHGYQLENSGSFAPDLRESALALNWPAFKSVVQDGALAGMGMPKFPLSDEQVRALYMYIRTRAREEINSAKGAHPH